MKIVRVSLNNNSYNIVIGRDIIRRLPILLAGWKEYNAVYVITNKYLKTKHGLLLTRALKKCAKDIRFKLVPDSENSKSFKCASLVLEDLIRFGRQKKVIVIGFGGGVVGDLAGFVASLYRRGVPLVQIPTTLLAQVDSSIGGKNAIDVSEGKNMVGTFYQPVMVVSDLGVLKTLPKIQLQSGLAEVIKYGLIRDEKLFSYLQTHVGDILKRSPFALEFIVTRSSAIKAGIVSRDEKERKNIRTILNFGHTIGHALEAAGKYRVYNHGQAIAIGMLTALDIGAELRITPPAIREKTQKLLKEIGLPTVISKVSLKKIVESHYFDKKFTGSQNRFVLLAGIAKTRIVRNVPLAVIKQSLRFYFG